MKLLKNTESKINKDKNVENMPYLEIAEVVYNIVTTIINKIQEPCIYLFLINHLIDY